MASHSFVWNKWLDFLLCPVLCLLRLWQEPYSCSPENRALTGLVLGRADPKIKERDSFPPLSWTCSPAHEHLSLNVDGALCGLSKFPHPRKVTLRPAAVNKLFKESPSLRAMTSISRIPELSWRCCLWIKWEPENTVLQDWHRDLRLPLGRSPIQLSKHVLRAQGIRFSTGLCEGYMNYIKAGISQSFLSKSFWPGRETSHK